MGQHLLAQCAEQAAPARLAAQVALADAHHVGLLLHADEAQHPRLPLALDDEPSVARPVVERVAAALAAHRGAGEEASHQGEERRLVLRRTQLQELAVLQTDHDALSSVNASESTSRRAKPNDSERAMSCLSSDMATRRQDGCALRFSRAGTPASGQFASG